MSEERNEEYCFGSSGYIDLYDVMEKKSVAAAIICLASGEFEDLLDADDIEKVCRHALIMAVTEFDPEKVPNFSAHLENVVKRELENMEEVRTLSPFEDEFFFPSPIPLNADEEALFKEFMMDPASKNMKCHAIQMLLKKLQKTQTNEKVWISDLIVNLLDKLLIEGNRR